MLPNILRTLLLFGLVYVCGYTTASIRYELVIQKYRDQVDAKLEKIEYGLTNILNTTSNTNTVLAKEFSVIRLDLKKQPLVVSKNGECLISQKFLDARLMAIDKANQR